jgi:short-subunit dehydrogenase
MDIPAKRHALVTGASSGLGRQISELLVKKGYDLIAVSNVPADLDGLKKHLEEIYGITVDTVNMDLSEETAAQTLYNYCKQKGHAVEVLVNDAGMLVYGPAAEVPFKKAQRILQLHVTTPALLCRLFSKNMIKHDKGFILNVSSISAVMPYPTISFYGPTKTFLRHFTRALRSELKPLGIFVTCLIPGAMDTPLLNEYQVDRRKAIKWRVVGPPEKVARSGIRALFKNRPECIPGFLNKLVVRLLPLIPPFVIGFIYKRLRKIT